MCLLLFSILNGQRGLLLSILHSTILCFRYVLSGGAGLGSDGSNSSTINKNVTRPWRIISRLSEQHCIISPRDGRLCIEWNFVFLFWREVREIICINTWVTRDEFANDSLGSIPPFSKNPPLPLILSHENPNIKHIFQFPFAAKCAQSQLNWE